MLETPPSGENFVADYQYAGFWHRFAALFIDALILLLPNIFINNIIPFAGPFLMMLFYKPIFESSPIRATPGKALMGIIVVTEIGERLTYKQALVRFLMSIVSGVCACAGFILALFTQRHQAFHDLIAGTIVINQQMPHENFFDIWINEMRYVFGRGTSEILSSDRNQESSTYSGGPTSFSSSRKVADTNAMESLEKLHKLFTDGAITEAEYNSKKAELLRRI